MSIEQILLVEIEESKRWLRRENDDSTYKRDLRKRIELMNLNPRDLNPACIRVLLLGI